MVLDINAAREGYKCGYISDIGFVRNSQNLAGGLTKAVHQAQQYETLRTGTLSVKPEQWTVGG